jgi:hypothetical protein
LLATLRGARAGLHDPVRTTFCDRCGQVSRVPQHGPSPGPRHGLARAVPSCPGRPRMAGGRTTTARPTTGDASSRAGRARFHMRLPQAWVTDKLRVTIWVGRSDRSSNSAGSSTQVGVHTNEILLGLSTPGRSRRSSGHAGRGLDRCRRWKVEEMWSAVSSGSRMIHAADSASADLGLASWGRSFDLLVGGSLRSAGHADGISD